MSAATPLELSAVHAVEILDSRGNPTLAVSVTLAGSIAPPTWVSLSSTGVVTGMPALVVAPSSLARMDTTGVLRVVVQRGSPVPAGHNGPPACAVLRTMPASASAWVTV